MNTTQDNENATSKLVRVIKSRITSRDGFDKGNKMLSDWVETANRLQRAAQSKPYQLSTQIPNTPFADCTNTVGRKRREQKKPAVVFYCDGRCNKTGHRGLHHAVIHIRIGVGDALFWKSVDQILTDDATRGPAWFERRHWLQHFVLSGPSLNVTLGFPSIRKDPPIPGSRQFSSHRPRPVQIPNCPIARQCKWPSRRSNISPSQPINSNPYTVSSTLAKLPNNILTVSVLPAPLSLETRMDWSSPECSRLL
jgi:hypothetical protein